MTTKHTADKVADSLLYLIAFCMPWAKPALPLLFALFGGVQLWRYAVHRKIYRPSCVIPLWTSITTYVLLVVYALCGFANDRANEILEIKFSYIAIPLMAYLIAPIHSAQMERLYKMFVLGCLGFDIIAIAHAAILFHQTSDATNLYYQGLSWYIHPSYQAMYHCFAIYLLARGILLKPLFGSSNIISFFLVIIFCGMMGALASKAGLVCLVAKGAGFILYSWVQRRAVKHITILTIASIVIVVLINAVLAGVSSRITEAGKDVGALVSSSSEEVMHTTAYSSVTLRIVTWSSAFQILIANPFGVGTGKASSYLDDYYISHEQPYAASLHLNAHQQFLQHGLDIGWIGILLLILTFYFLGRHLVRAHNYSGVIFCLLCFVNFLLESMLETQAGIIFFFFWLMVYCKEDQEVVH
jgi:hypothetical protein